MKIMAYDERERMRKGNKIRAVPGGFSKCINHGTFGD
jgi:hypothetical protein